MPITGYGIDFILIDDVDELEEQELPICEKCLLEIAQVMYEACRVSYSTMDNFDASEMETWEQLPDELKQHWLNISLAANRRVFQIARKGHTNPDKAH